MPKFTVKAAIDHDNKRYEPGKTVDLNDEAAASLLAVGAIEAKGKKEVATTTDSDSEK